MRNSHTEIGNLELRDHSPFSTIHYPFPLPIDTPAKIAPGKPTAAGPGASLLVTNMQATMPIETKQTSARSDDSESAGPNLIGMISTIKNTVSNRVALLALCTFLILIGAPPAALASEIHFHGVFPKSDGCALIYGSFEFSFAGRDFFLEDCESSSRLIKSFESIGHIKRIQFVAEDTAWGIVGGSIVRFDSQNRDVVVDVVIRENDEIKLESIFFLDNQNGWASGRNGMILRTVDGGQTWASVKTNTKADIIDLGFVDKEFGWATVNTNDLENFTGAYLATRDGGQTWKSIPLPRNASLSPLAFTSRDHACGVKSRNEIMCTFNGNDWTTARLDAENRGDFHFVDSKLGWHVGSSIIRTMDGGRTWQYVLQDKDERNRAFSGLNLDGVVFADNKKGWAWGPTSIYKTTDSGETWIDVANKLFLILKN